MGQRDGELSSQELGIIGERFAKYYIPVRLSWQYVGDHTTRATQHKFGDFMFRRGQRIVNVDSKIEQKKSDNFPAEMWQCVDKKEPGWMQYADDCDYVLYSQVKTDIENKTWQVWWHGIWIVHLKGLQNVDITQFRVTQTKKNYGNTELRLVPLDWLIKNELAIDLL